MSTPADMFQATEGRWGSREVEITDVTLVGADGTPGHVFQSGDAMEVRVKTRAHQPTKDFVFGIGLFNADGICCYGTNTNIEELEPAEISGEGEIRFASPVSTWWKAPTRSTSRRTSSTAIRTTTIGCSTPSA